MITQAPPSVISHTSSIFYQIIVLFYKEKTNRICEKTKTFKLYDMFFQKQKSGQKLPRLKLLFHNKSNTVFCYR